jgi:Na+/H+ antiporter NhaC
VLAFSIAAVCSLSLMIDLYIRCNAIVINQIGIWISSFVEPIYYNDYWYNPGDFVLWEKFLRINNEAFAGGGMYSDLINSVTFFLPIHILTIFCFIIYIVSVSGFQKNAIRINVLAFWGVHSCLIVFAWTGHYLPSIFQVEIPLLGLRRGIFAAAPYVLLASFLSLSSGTSVGAIVALGPIAIQLAQKSGADLNLIGASLLGGAMFGDNLSVISDTTIAAAQTLGSSMKDKFRTNFYLAAPAVVLTVVILLIIGFSNPVAPIAYTPTPISWELIFPYLVVLVLAFLGLDVFLVLVIGIFLAGAIGLWQGNLTWLSFAKASYEGFTSMTEIFLLSLLTGGLAALVEKAGGIQYLLNKIEAKISSAKSAQLGAGLITGLVNLCIANNTVSILISGKVLRPISERFEVPARKMASVIDIFACIVQGLLPYGAQVLLIIGYSKNKINYVDMLSHSYYLGLLFLMVVGSMFWGRSRNVVSSGD